MIEYNVIVDDEGNRFWHLNGKLHRADGPAVEWTNGTRRWYLNGKKHREGAPAVEWGNGDREWYFDGERHREDGPAIEWGNGDRVWYLNGRRHREDGPAIELADGHRVGISTANCIAKMGLLVNGPLALVSGGSMTKKCLNPNTCITQALLLAKWGLTA